jgi:hypothetical protein
MANKYGTTYTKTLTPTPANKVDATTWGGRVRYIYDVYEAAAVAQGDVIYLAKLPKGAVILPQSQLVYDALGSSSALAVGYGTTPAALLASTATTSAGSANLISVSLSTDADVFVTVSGSGAATGTVAMHMLYAYK